MRHRDTSLEATVTRTSHRRHRRGFTSFEDLDIEVARYAANVIGDWVDDTDLVAHLASSFGPAAERLGYTPDYAVIVEETRDDWGV